MILPSSPRDDEKILYLGTRRFLFYIPSAIAFLLLITGIFLFSLSQPAFYIYALFGAVLLFYLGVSYFIGFLGEDFDYRLHKSLVRSWSSATPSVDVFYATCGEEISVVENALWHISKLEYRGRLNVYVLDDGGRDEVKSLSERFKFSYIRRPNLGELKKAGNLRHAFARTSGEFILILDADFCPRRDMITEMMPYMMEYPKIGILQSPQFFSIREGQTWVEKGASYIQELFYRMIQVSRNYFDASICVGTCALYRRKALEPFGGTAPIGYSEDVHTGFQIMRDGWLVKYIPINLAKGVCPDLISAFFMQQYRWAMGSITLFMNPEFWKAKLTLMQRLCYLSGMFYYMVTGVAIFLTPLPAMVLVAFFPEHVFWYNCVFSVPSFLFGIFGIGLWTKAKFGWYAPTVRLISFYAHFFAFRDKLMGSLVPWQATGAVKGGKRYDDFLKTFKVWTWFQFLWVVGFILLQVRQFEFYHFIPTLFFVSFNFWISLMAMRDEQRG